METESSKYSDFSLAELWQPPVGGVVTGKGGTFSCSAEVQGLSLPVRLNRVLSDARMQVLLSSSLLTPFYLFIYLKIYFIFI